MYSGNKAISILAKEIDKFDHHESSHWKYLNKNIKYDKNIISGFSGFGDASRRFYGIQNFLHFLFQSPFRKQGHTYKNFKQYDLISRRIALKQNRSYDINCLRQTLFLSYLNQKNNCELKNIIKTEPVVCIIGDGFGYMASLLIKLNITKKIYLVNLSKVLLIDLIYLKKVFGENKFNNCVNLVQNSDDLQNIEKKSLGANEFQIIALEAKKFHLLEQCNFNFVMNIHSMQEMNYNIIDKYFNYIRKSKYKDKILFYCCNRVKKTLFDGEELIFDDYPWKKNDKIVFDETCPNWNQRTYMSKAPFYVNYDGKHKHRLVFLSRS
ncbi:MAG: hypothetical protein CFH22_00541 [Alphaproteobacteria bacterium MarineAlpha5_Bin12]|nr:MAG: hypothetical protein CFH22_00541 [Alphaproteobacteria bacterium MarineAlpha5_Bin12]